MLSPELLPSLPNELATADRADRGFAEQAPLLSLVRQASPPPTLRRVGPPPAPEADRAGTNLADWVSAASHAGTCGVVICDSPEQAISLMLFATRGAPGNQVEAAPGSHGDAMPWALPHPRCDRSLLTLLFTDIVGSTRTVERLGDEAWQGLLLEHHAIVRTQLTAFDGREVDHAGDGFFATFGRPSHALQCAEAIRSALEAIGIVVRAGVHAGECQTVDGQVTGVAVHVAARICSTAQPGEVLVSASLKDLVAGSGLAFSDRQWHSLKGLSGTRQLFALNRAGATLGPAAKRQGPERPLPCKLPLQPKAKGTASQRLRARKAAPLWVPTRSAGAGLTAAATSPAAG